MSDGKFTPGPWIVSDHLYAADGKRVASYQMLSRDDDENEANARLIAAAPELYALVYRASMLNRDAGEIGAGMLASLVDEAVRLVSKATGESHEHLHPHR